MTGQQQRLDALAIANQRRGDKAREKQAIKAGRLDPVRVARTTELPYTIGELWRSMPGVGTVRIRKAVKRTGLVTSARITGLTPDRRFLFVRATEVLQRHPGNPRLQRKAAA